MKRIMIAGAAVMLAHGTAAMAADIKVGSAAAVTGPIA